MMRGGVVRVVTFAVLIAGCGDDTTAGDGGSSSSSTVSTSTGATGSSTSTAGGTADTGTTEPLVADAGVSRYVIVGDAVALDGSGSTGATTYQWDFGDGSAPTAPSPDPEATVTYAAPGRYQAVLIVTDDTGASRSDQVTITATFEPSHVPRQSGTIARTSADLVAAVSTDTDELTIIERSDDGFAVRVRTTTARRPKTVAVRTDEAGFVVACQDEPAVQFVSETGIVERTVPLPRGSRPYGVVARGSEVFVTLQGTGELARIDAVAGTVVDTWPAIVDARGVAVLPDGRIAVTRWRSPDAEGQIAIVDPVGGAGQPWTLQFDPKDASDTESGGVPTYLSQLLVSPMGDQVAVPSMQANIGQGLFRNGAALTFERTVRGVISYIELPSNAENFDRRKQFDDRGFMTAGTFSSKGDWLFLVARGSRAVERVDVFTGGQSGSILDVGFAPDGAALTIDDRFLLVNAAMSREVVVYDVTSFDMLPAPLFRLSTVTAEPLPANVLRGKQLFNDSFDPRLAQDSYIACAHCHLDGEADHRTWDFTDRGEGLRNTISLLGRSGVGHGPIHWSANFDEVQDFEHDIRFAFGGVGLMSDAEFNTGTRNTTLGDPKAGVSADLDALAAYVESLSTYPDSPFRNPDGSMTPDAVAGQAIFVGQGCDGCHASGLLTDSTFVMPGQPLLHDVGTLGPGSGQRLGMPLPGIDTPTLHGLWNDAPYLHDGSAATVREVLTTRNVGDAHGNTSTLTPTQLDQLERYLLSLEG